MNEKIRVKVSRAGLKRLDILEGNLDIQIELLFSCLLRKRVLFRRSPDVATYSLHSDNEKLNICFRPVMTKVCLISETEDAPDLEDFPIHNVQAFIPSWLKLDYNKKTDCWSGEYGWL